MKSRNVKNSVESILKSLELTKEFGRTCAIPETGECQEVLEKIKKENDRVSALNGNDGLDSILTKEETESLTNLTAKSFASGECQCALDVLGVFGYRSTPGDSFDKCRELDKELKEETDQFIKKFTSNHRSG